MTLETAENWLISFSSNCAIFSRMNADKSVFFNYFDGRIHHKELPKRTDDTKYILGQSQSNNVFCYFIF